MTELVQKGLNHKPIQEWVEKVCSARFDGRIEGEGIYLTRCGLAAWVAREGRDFWQTLHAFFARSESRIARIWAPYTEQGEGEDGFPDDDITHSLCSRPILPEFYMSMEQEERAGDLMWQGIKQRYKGVIEEASEIQVTLAVLTHQGVVLQAFERAAQWGVWLREQHKLWAWRKEAKRHKEEGEEVLFDQGW